MQSQNICTNFTAQCVIMLIGNQMLKQKENIVSQKDVIFFSRFDILLFPSQDNENFFVLNYTLKNNPVSSHLSLFPPPLPSLFLLHIHSHLHARIISSIIILSQSDIITYHHPLCQHHHHPQHKYNMANVEQVVIMITYYYMAIIDFYIISNNYILLYNDCIMYRDYCI